MTADSIQKLLDPNAMAGLFAEIAGLRERRWRSCEMTSLWVKPGRHFNACYRLTADATAADTVLASAFVLDEERAALIASNAATHEARTADRGGCRHCRTRRVGRDLLLQLFPLDYRLPTLPACLDVDTVARTAAAPDEIVGCEPSGYRPGMRCQIRYRTAAGTDVYGKVAVERAPGHAAAMHARVHRALARGVWRVRVAAPLGYAPELQLTLVSAGAGESLHLALRSGRTLDGEIEAAAKAIGDFHRLEVGEIERVYAPRDEIRLLGEWVGLVAELCPELSLALRAQHAELVRSCPEAGAPVLVHRDFYDKQLLCSSAAPTLLDMDTACLGDREIDLGNFCGHLRLRALQWNCAEYCRALEDGFLASYSHPIARDRLSWYRKATLLRLACGYALRPRWHHLAPALIAEALDS